MINLKYILDFFVQPKVKRVTFQGHFQGNHAKLGVKGV